MFLKSKLNCCSFHTSSEDSGADVQITPCKLGEIHAPSRDSKGLHHYEQRSEEKDWQEGEADFETAIAAAGFGKFNIILMLAVVPCIMSSSFSTTSVTYIVGSASCELQMSHLDQGVLDGMVYGGMSLSAFVWGPLSDYCGRRRLMIILFVCDGICCILASTSPTFWMLAMFKFLGGFIISGPGAALYAFVAEYHSAKYRSQSMMVTGMFNALAVTLIPLLAWYFIPQTWSTKIFGLINYSPWRLFVTVSAVPSMVAAIVLLFFDESPKFLLAIGKKDEALRVLQKVYRMNTGRDVHTYPVQLLVQESKDSSAPVVSGVPDSEMNSTSRSPLQIYFGQIKPIFAYPNVLKAALICCMQFTGLLSVNMIRLWIPEMFASMQEFALGSDNLTSSSSTLTICDMLGSLRDPLESHSHALHNETSGTEPCSEGAMQSATYVDAVIVGGTVTVANLLGSCVIRLVGKRQLCMGGFFVCALCCVWAVNSSNPKLTVGLLAVFIAVGDVSNMSNMSAIVDVFPSNLCAMAVSLALTFGRIGSLIGSTIFPLLLEVHCQLPFYLVCGISAATCVLSTLLPKEKTSVDKA